MSKRRSSLLRTGYRLLDDLDALARLGLSSRARLAAENLFLRKQLALYQERRAKPRRLDPATRVALVLLSRWLDWRSLLLVVQREWINHYNRERPHTSLGPGFPERSPDVPPPKPSGHQLAARHRIVATPILGGLHHGYRLEREVA